MDLFERFERVRHRHHDHDVDRAELLEIIEELVEIIVGLLAKPAPVSLTLHALGVPMPVSLNPGQSVVYSYTEQDAAGNTVPNVGTAAFSVSDEAIISVADNGDGTATVGYVGAGVGTLSLSVTLDDGTILSASDDVTDENAPPTAVTLVPGVPTP